MKLKKKRRSRDAATRSRFLLLGLGILLLRIVGLEAESVDDWIQRLEAFSRSNDEEARCWVVTDDWETGGDWPGRYGRFAWVLCGMSGRWEYLGGPGIEKFKYRPYLGENHALGDGVRCWLHWPFLPAAVPEGLSPEERDKLRGPVGALFPTSMSAWEWSDLRRVLVNPVDGGRRQANWDDHAEGYSPWFNREGPHLYLDVELPEGQFLLSLYFVNADAHWGGVNRFRDYLIQVKNSSPKYGDAPGWERDFEGAATLAESRVHDFYSGVYKRFLVLGPASLALRIHKGDSLNTVLSGIFVDQWVRRKAGIGRGGFQSSTRMKWQAGKGNQTRPLDSLVFP